MPCPPPPMPGPPTLSGDLVTLRAIDLRLFTKRGRAMTECHYVLDRTTWPARRC